MPVVFITGGSRRIGKGLVHGFARKGWDVGFIYRQSRQQALLLQNQLAGSGVKVVAEQADISNEHELESALTNLDTLMGSPDVIVSNAGVFPQARGLLELTNSDVMQTLAVNTLPLLTIARWYKQRPTGRIIAISSLGAHEIWKNRIEYGVSKTALVRLGENLARTMAPTHTVNMVAPGMIAVPDDPSPAETEVSLLHTIPMGRYGSPEDIFDAVWFFATASPYITGQSLIVDGGYHLVR